MTPGDGRPVDERAATLRRLCDRLWAAPLFHLSLNSRELFHSNFLAWLFEHYPEDSAGLLSDWAGADRWLDGPVTVRREWHHLDLKISVPDRHPIVVENKVFSLPDIGQLDGYTKDVVGVFQDPALILLSMVSPNWPDGAYTTNGRTWRWVSYGDLADALEPVAKTMVSGDDVERRFAGELVRRYVAIVRDIANVLAVAARVEGGEPLLLPDGLAAILAETRLHDAVGKLRAYEAIAFLRATAGLGLVGGRKVEWESGFTNGTPLIGAGVKLATGDWVGWQMQGGQFRLYVIPAEHSGGAPEARAARVAYVERHYGSYVDFGPLEAMTGSQDVPRTEAAGGWNRYDPNLVYRYRWAPSLTLNQVGELSRHYLIEAASLAVGGVSGASV